jgi:ubiquinone/menaquinone biosynthesis C-methylase UbiE
LSRDVEERKSWDSYYRLNAPHCLPWETGKPEGDLVELVKRGAIRNGRVLDICSGLGTQAIYLAKQGFEVYGVDISPTAVKMAFERCRNENVSCHLREGDASNLSYPEGFFSFVFDRGCFHSVRPASRVAFVQGVHRVLQNSGGYYLKCFSEKNSKAWNHFTKEDIWNYFSDPFKIMDFKEEVFVESTRGDRVYLYSTLMGAVKD